MTEQEWMQCNDPQLILDFIYGKVSERKLRLFNCACCRRGWHLLKDVRLRNIVEIAEQYADGQETEIRLEEAWTEGWRQWGELATHDDVQQSAEAEACGAATRAAETPHVNLDASEHAANAIDADAGDRNDRKVDCEETARADERSRQLVLLRDILGNPFLSVALNSTWFTTTILELAQAVYDNRCLPEGTLDCDRLSILADALEDAGCTDADILDHLRSDGPHVRGCWALDRILARS